jgi:hypothetical protein
MVYLYYCKACENGDHGKCELSTPSPEGTYGGRKCRCSCTGDPLWGKDPVSEEMKNWARKHLRQIDTDRKLAD